MALAQSVAGRFPTLETPTSLEVARGKRIHKVGPGMLPAASFAADPPDARLILQNDMLGWTWTKTIGPSPTEYPRYPRLREDLLWFVDLVDKHFGETLKIESINMGYTNFVPTSGHSTIETLGQYVSPEVHAGVIKNSSFLHEVTLNWRASNGLDRRFQFAAAERALGDEKTDGYLLITNIGGFLTEGQSPVDKLDEIHFDLQDFFKSLITEQARKEWGYVERGR